MKRIILTESQLLRILAEEEMAGNPDGSINPSGHGTTSNAVRAVLKLKSAGVKSTKVIYSFLVSLLSRGLIVYGEIPWILSNIFEKDTQGEEEKKSMLTSIGHLFGYGQDSSVYDTDSRWLKSVEEMGEWYQDNVHTYQGDPAGNWTGKRAGYKCGLVGGLVYDDCSAFVKACLQLYGVPGIQGLTFATGSMQPGSKFDSLLRNCGFKRFRYDTKILKPGDIICGGPKTHTEIYAGDGKSYAWGNIHDGLKYHGKQRQGMPCKMATSTKFRWIWRAVGSNNDTEEL